MRGETFSVIAVASAVAVVLLGCAPAGTGVAESLSPSRTVSAPATPAAVTFASVIDGDTIDTSEGKVRIIGIDTPERGECGDDEASAAITAVLATGDPLALELPAGQNDRDRYGRLIRYVTTTAGVDVGLLQLQAGNAVARYDSTDGYPAHPREAQYRAAQIAAISPEGTVITPACQQAAVAPPVNNWWMQYASCTKLKKNTVGDPTGPFNRDDPAQAAIYDWFANGTGNNGDGDGDGLACE